MGKQAVYFILCFLFLLTVCNALSLSRTQSDSIIRINEGAKIDGSDLHVSLGIQYLISNDSVRFINQSNLIIDIEQNHLNRAFEIVNVTACQGQIEGVDVQSNVLLQCDNNTTLDYSPTFPSFNRSNALSIEINYTNVSVYGSQVGIVVNYIVKNFTIYPDNQVFVLPGARRIWWFDFDVQNEIPFTAYVIVPTGNILDRLPNNAVLDGYSPDGKWWLKLSNGVDQQIWYSDINLSNIAPFIWALIGALLGGALSYTLTKKSAGNVEQEGDGMPVASQTSRQTRTTESLSDEDRKYFMSVNFERMKFFLGRADFLLTGEIALVALIVALLTLLWSTGGLSLFTAAISVICALFIAWFWPQCDRRVDECKNRAKVFHKQYIKHRNALSLKEKYGAIANEDDIRKKDLERFL